MRAWASRDRLLPLGLAALIVLADQLSKALVLERIPAGGGVWIARPYVELIHVRNPGIAFGLELGGLSRPFFIIASILVLAVLVSLYRSTPARERVRRLAIVVLSAGAVGNLVDRIHWAAGVVDFVRVTIGGYEWPIFNVADMAVTTGAIVLGLTMLAEARPSRDF